MSLPTGTGSNFIYMDRQTPAYGAVISINGVQTTGWMNTTDTRGKLRITRIGSTVTAYYLSGSTWQPLVTASGASTAPSTGVYLAQYAQRNEAVALKINVDNFDATSNKSAYSPVATVTTPGYSTTDGTCP